MSIVAVAVSGVVVECAVVTADVLKANMRVA